jgi:hypothetical protein
MAELQIATVGSQAALSLFTDLKSISVFEPAALHRNSLKSMLGDREVRACGIRAFERNSATFGHACTS